MVQSVSPYLNPLLVGSSSSPSPATDAGLSGDASAGPVSNPATPAPPGAAPVQWLSGDVATAFQQLASDLKALLIQIQTDAAGNGTPPNDTAAATGGTPSASDGAETQEAHGWHGHRFGQHGFGRLAHDLGQLVLDLLNGPSPEAAASTAGTSAGGGQTTSTGDAAAGSTATGSGATALADAIAQDLKRALNAYAENIGVSGGATAKPNAATA